MKIVRESTVKGTPRLRQVEGMFDFRAGDKSRIEWDLNLDLDFDWKVGLIVGPSGSGKTTIATELFGDNIVTGFDWPRDKSLLDGFSPDLSIKKITGMLTAVGFSTPPDWVRPFGVLSNGQQFRVMLARAILEAPSPIVIDEFTSVVDRTVAKIGSAAVSKAMRRSKDKQLVALSCHYDIVEWLEPDWVFDLSTARLARDRLQRPKIHIAVRQCHHKAWELFSRHHYLTGAYNKSARMFVAFWKEEPVAMTSVVSQPGATSGWRMHRTVVLPDYQGVGIGSQLSDYIAGCYSATGKPVWSGTAHPALIRSKARSKEWFMHREPKFTQAGDSLGSETASTRRKIAGFTYVGPKHTDAAREFGLI